MRNFYLKHGKYTTQNSKHKQPHLKMGKESEWIFWKEDAQIANKRNGKMLNVTHGPPKKYKSKPQREAPLHTHRDGECGQGCGETGRLAPAAGNVKRWRTLGHRLGVLQTGTSLVPK